MIEKAQIAYFVAQRVPGIASVRDFGEFQAAAFAPGGVILAGAIFNNYKDFDVNVTLAADPAWRSKQAVYFLRGIAHLVFEQWGCRRMSAIVSKRNKKARHFVERVGFQLEGTVKYGYDGFTDAIYYGLLRERAGRWLRTAHNGRT